jgi:hypothetical protein
MAPYASGEPEFGSGKGVSASLSEQQNPAAVSCLPAGWNGPVYLAFALYVATSGSLSTQSGRGQRPRGASEGPIDEERNRKHGGGRVTESLLAPPVAVAAVSNQPPRGHIAPVAPFSDSCRSTGTPIASAKPCCVRASGDPVGSSNQPSRPLPPARLRRRQHHPCNGNARSCAHLSRAIRGIPEIRLGVSPETTRVRIEHATRHANYEFAIVVGEAHTCAITNRASLGVGD